MIANARHARTALGQEARIVRNCRDSRGRQSYALKTREGTVLAIDWDIAPLIDEAERRYLKLTTITEQA